MKTLRQIAIMAVLVLVGAVAVAQSSPKITSHLSADTVMIGDRVTLTVEVEKDMMQNIIFPIFDFKQADEERAQSEPSIEVITDFAPDTIALEGRKQHIRKRYEMAVYDEGIYDMGRAQVLYIGKNIVDTLYAEQEHKLVVKTFQIDSTMTTVRDLKPQMTLSFRFGEVSGYVGISLAVVLLIAGVLYLLVRYLHSRGKHISTLFRPTPPPPPHIVAIEALEKLRNEKLWQNNKHKLYYSGLSDILRTYLAGRFEVGAMEMTTDEIAEALRVVDIEQKSKMDLLSVLRDADLVKFAKATPEANDNELAYDKAFYFVENTKPVEVVEEEDEPTKNEVR
ncbi:MAG: hypothetical protein E7147_00390 [Rikenellaceae bacterium]|nr:hypothetical protein [Rikenellaceae bacterium]